MFLSLNIKIIVENKVGEPGPASSEEERSLRKIVLSGDQSSNPAMSFFACKFLH